MKRLLVFLLLLTIGIVAMWLAIGDEQAIAHRGPDTERPPTPQLPPGIPLQADRYGAEVSHRGFFRLTQWREVAETASRVRREQVLALTARNSQPLADGRMQLDDIEVQLFDDDQHAATLVAKQAFARLRTGADGRPQLAAGTDIDLRDIVFTTLPTSAAPDLRLELPTARLKIEDDEVLLTSPRSEPVLLVLDGEPRATLRGLGMQARLPGKNRGALRRADVEILQDPVLETAGLLIRSRGRLRFQQDLASGAGLVTLEDRVECDVTHADLALPGGAGGDGADAGRVGTMRIRGDQFFAWLQRHAASAGEAGAHASKERGADWRQIVLLGAPATIELPGGHVTTPRVTAVPGVLGDPLVITAHGGASRFEQTERRPGARVQELLTGTTERRMHFVMPRAQGAAMHRSFGFPRWAMRPVETLHVVVVEGAAELAGDSGTRCRAHDGLRIYRREGSETGVVRGFGPVHIEKPARPGEQDLVADGSDGFWLTVTPDGERLHLGPPMPTDPNAPGRWREHTFDVRYGGSRLRGRGVGEIEASGDDTRFAFLSPDAAIHADLPEHGLQLGRVRRLLAKVTGKDVRELDVAGWPLDMAWSRGGESLLTTAPRIVQTGPRSLQLLPADAANPGLWSGMPGTAARPNVRRGTLARGNHGAQQIDVSGPRIDVHHAGGNELIVDAIAVDDELPHVYARLDGPGGAEGTTIACAAERLRVLPFTLPRETRQWLARGDGAFARVAMQGAARPWLMLDDVREFALDDPRQGHVEGEARRLYVTDSGRAALFVGDEADAAPARVTRTRDGRSITLRGSRVRLTQDAEVQLQALGTFADGGTFTPPSMTLRDAGRGGLLSHMRAVCRGNIEVTPKAVSFGGPVSARGLGPAGELDPAGVHIDARELELLRAATGDGGHGDVERAIGRDITVAWSGLRARCAEMDLDVPNQRLVAVDPDEAVVTLPGGRELRAPRVELDYRNLSWRLSPARVVQYAVPEVGK